MSKTKTTVKPELTATQEAQIIKYLKDHTRGETKKKFGVSIGKITALRKKGKIKGPSGSRSALL
jgi:hypothetical protein